MILVENRSYFGMWVMLVVLLFFGIDVLVFSVDVFVVVGNREIVDID